jgi:hypothetical protein
MTVGNHQILVGLVGVGAKPSSNAAELFVEIESRYPLGKSIFQDKFEVGESS